MSNGDPMEPWRRQAEERRQLLAQMTPEQRRDMEVRAAEARARMVRALAPAAHDAIQRWSATVAPALLQLAEVLRRSTDGLSRQLAAVPPETWENVVAVLATMGEMQRRVRSEIAPDGSSALRQMTAEGWAPPVVRASSAAVAASTITATATVFTPTVLTDSDGRSWVADWYWWIAGLLLVQYVVATTAADMVWPDSDWIQRMESHIALAIALGGLAEAGRRRWVK